MDSIRWPLEALEGKKGICNRPGHIHQLPLRRRPSASMTGVSRGKLAVDQLHLCFPSLRRQLPCRDRLRRKSHVPHEEPVGPRPCAGAALKHTLRTALSRSNSIASLLHLRGIHFNPAHRTSELPCKQLDRISAMMSRLSLEAVEPF